MRVLTNQRHQPMIRIPLREPLHPFGVFPEVVAHLYTLDEGLPALALHLPGVARAERN
jgi:hypothetical protein